VSPEILKGNAAHLSTDLWAFGCIIYQMLAGVPPFRAGSEYLIFQKITACDFSFPEDFDEDAKDLVSRLLQFDPKTRIGSNDLNEIRYCTIRKHRFFDGIMWERLRELTPPELSSSRLSDSDDEIDDRIEPGEFMKHSS
jgi:3-phosphoinositide dependent protein kinase-1